MIHESCVRPCVHDARKIGPLQLYALDAKTTLAVYASHWADTPPRPLTSTTSVLAGGPMMAAAVQLGPEVQRCPQFYYNCIA